MCQDWRSVPIAVIHELYAAEQRRWENLLDWDPGGAWTELERGRLLGTVSGLVAFGPDGRPAGWTYFLVHGGALQVGGFVADSEATAVALLDGICSAPVSDAAERVTFFAFTDAPGLVAALRARGLVVDRYWYLRRNLVGAVGTPGSDMRSWTIQQADATAALLRRAFEHQDASRPFAPDGTAEEWQDYVTQLVTGAGCGSLLPAACYGIGAGPGRLAAIALVTRIGPMTAHLAQLAVDPQMRGQRIGSALVEAACGAAARAGCTRMTLLVGGRNQAARALYQRARFEPAGSFIAAGGSYPRRSTSVAPGGVIMTRR